MKVLSDTVGEFKLTLQKGIYVDCVKKYFSRNVLKQLFSYLRSLKINLLGFKLNNYLKHK